VEIINALTRLASLAKSTLVDASDRAAVNRMASQYGICCKESSLLDAAVERLCTVLFTCAEQRNVIDYDDMIWHIVIHDIPVQTYSWVVVDEAQDLNNLQIDVLKRMLARDGRCVAVGDRFQSIYGFRGANTQAIPLLIEALSATVLPLNVCYRCPSRHIELAKRLVPQIEAREGAAPGVVSRYTLAEAHQQFQDGNLVLCRVNAPLVSVCLDLIRRGRKASIKGRDIGQSLINLIESTRANTLAELREAIQEYRERETARLMDKGEDSAAQLVDDRCAVIDVIAARPEIQTAADVVAFINNLFQDDSNEGVICSSVHKAKGLEADAVFILYPEMMPSKFAKTPEDQQQERNIEYVALTRSKSFLGFITK
jgi:DNA helicase-2/ATP-dependent DNA helicase PcrA